MTRPAVIAALAGAFCAALPCVAGAQTYDAFKQFNFKVNPHGPWSYDLNGAALPQTTYCDSAMAVECWWNGGAIPNSAIVGANKSGATASYYTIVVPKNYLVLDPEQLGSASVQWTAPSAGKVALSGNFLGIDTSEASHMVAILHNTATLRSYTIMSYRQKQKFSFNVTVAAGDTISFVSYSQGYAYLSTGLQATITLQ